MDGYQTGQTRIDQVVVCIGLQPFKVIRLRISENQFLIGQFEMFDLQLQMTALQ